MIDRSDAFVTEDAVSVTPLQRIVVNLGRGRTVANVGAEAGDFATHVSIKALHYLIALAECLNFSRAANRCAVTQPTLSIQVRKLEDYLGVKLFERNRTRVVITDDGEKVLRLARIVVGAADEILGIRRTRMREKFVHHAETNTA